MPAIVKSAVPILAAALTAAVLIVALRPLLDRYAVAKPNARSMHVTPTAQGGGIAVTIAAIVGCMAGAWLGLGRGSELATLATILGAAAALAAVGALDDLMSLPVAPRLLAHTVAAAILIACLPDGARLLPPAVPLAFERSLLLLAIVWFINLTNFMDGMDWMTVVEVVPICAAVAIFWLAGLIVPEAGLPALALLGAMLAFAPSNKPVARLFLGDVGSLPIGLLLAWMLILVGIESLAAAILLPLYYAADATVTLLRRLFQGERIFHAHRNHFYQRARNGGLSVPQIVGAVAVLNAALAGLAAAALLSSSTLSKLVLLVFGMVLTAGLLAFFTRGTQ